MYFNLLFVSAYSFANFEIDAFNFDTSIIELIDSKLSFALFKTSSFSFAIFFLY